MFAGHRLKNNALYLGHSQIIRRVCAGTHKSAGRTCFKRYKNMTINNRGYEYE